MATLLIVIEVLPEFIALKVVPFVPSTGTFPKLRLVLAKFRVLAGTLLEGGICWLKLPWLNPWQPTRKVRPRSRKHASTLLRRSFSEFARPRLFRIRQSWNRCPRVPDCLGQGDGSFLVCDSIRNLYRLRRYVAKITGKDSDWGNSTFMEPVKDSGR